MICLLLLGSQTSHGQDARFNLTDVSVSQAAAVLQDFTGQAVVLASDVSGSITLSSSKPLDRREAIVLFATALRAKGLTLHSATGEIMVTQASSSSPRTARERDSAIETRIFILQHLSVAEVSPAVRALLSRQGEISAKNNNTLIVSDKYSGLLEITQYLMTTDRAKEPLSAQLECRRVLDAARVLQRHFTASPTKTFLDVAQDELWGRQLRVLIQTLEEGAGCTNDAHPATPNEKHPLVVSATERSSQTNQLSARDGPLEGILAPEVRTAIQQPALRRELAASPDEATNRALGVALENWRGAWSRCDVAAYFGFYAPHFLPANESTPDDWKKKRKAVMASTGEVSVDITDLSLTLADPTHATMVFTQTYQSRSYRGVVTKNLQWVHVEGSWLIARESVVKRLSGVEVK